MDYATDLKFLPLQTVLPKRLRTIQVRALARSAEFRLRPSAQLMVSLLRNIKYFTRGGAEGIRTSGLRSAGTRARLTAAPLPVPQEVILPRARRWNRP